MTNGIDRKLIRRLLDTGFFHIVGSSVINKVVQTLLSVILVRLLSKGAYGIYAYAYNILSFFILFNALGMPSALLQICSEEYKDKVRVESIFRFGTRIGAIFDCALGITIVLVAVFAPLSISGGRRILAFYAPLPLLQFLSDSVLTRLRVELRNREYALMTNLQTLLVALASVLGAWGFGAEGLAFGQSIGTLTSYLLGKALFMGGISQKYEKLEEKGRFDLLNIGAISAFNNGISQALTLVGTFLVGNLMANDEMVASYKVATTIPFALVFIPLMLVTYITPYFARNRFDRVWTLKYYWMVISGLCLMMGMICGVLGICARQIVLVLFGTDYFDSVIIMQLLLVGTFVTTAFRVPTGNLLVTQRKLLANTVCGVLSIAINTIVSLLLIPSYGMYGAAVAYVSTMIFGAIFNTSYYLYTVHSLPQSEINE